MKQAYADSLYDNFFPIKGHQFASAFFVNKVFIETGSDDYLRGFVVETIKKHHATLEEGEVITPLLRDLIAADHASIEKEIFRFKRDIGRKN